MSTQSVDLDDGLEKYKIVVHEETVTILYKNKDGASSALFHVIRNRPVIDVISGVIKDMEEQCN